MRRRVSASSGKRCVAVALSWLVFAYPVMAEQVMLPAGTVVYAEIQERVTSKKGDTFEGDLVEAVVWRDVVINRQVVIGAGTPMAVKVSRVKKAKMAGIKGVIELRAFSTNSSDDTFVPLIGGYDKSGRSKMALAITLGALFIIPIIIKGKQAILEVGTVFDAQVQANTELEIAAPAARRVIKMGSGMSIEVEILYDEIPEEGTIKVLPLRLELCGEALGAASVVTVNDVEIEPIEITLTATVQEEDCSRALGEIDLKEIGKHFTRGINRFEVGFGSQTTEVLLEIEL